MPAGLTINNTIYEQNQTNSSFNTTLYCITQYKKNTIYQLTTMLSTSKNILFPGHNHLLTTGTDDLALWLSPSLAQGDN